MDEHYEDYERMDASFGSVMASTIKLFGAIDNPASGEGTSMDKQSHARIRGPSCLSRDQIRGLLANSWAAQKAATKAPQHALKMGVKLAFRAQKELEEDIKAEFIALGVMEKLLEGLCSARAFGGAALLLLVQDESSRQGPNGEYDASRPLYDEDGVLLPGLKRLAGLYVIEGGRDCHLRPADRPPAWAGPKHPLVEWTPGKHWAKPIWWEWQRESEHTDDLTGTPVEPVKIHRDRLIFLGSGVYTDKETKKHLGGWDLGIFDAAVTALVNLESTQTAVVNIIQDFFTVVGKVKNFKKIISSGKTASLIDRFQANAVAKSVLHMWICDAEDEEITKEGAPVAGLEGLVDKQMDWAAGALHMRRSLLYDEESAGAGEAGQAAWDNDCETLREFNVLPALYTIVDLLRHAEERPAQIRDFAIGFPPLQRPSLEELSTAYRTLAHGDEINVKGGILTREEVRSRHLSVDGLTNIKVDGEEPPDESEFLQLAQAPGPGNQREAGENTETQGKVENSVAKR
jgi:hypothetical protein